MEGTQKITPDVEIQVFQKPKLSLLAGATWGYLWRPLTHDKPGSQGYLCWLGLPRTTEERGIHGCMHCSGNYSGQMRATSRKNGDGRDTWKKG